MPSLQCMLLARIFVLKNLGKTQESGENCLKTYGNWTQVVEKITDV